MPLRSETYELDEDELRRFAQECGAVGAEQTLSRLDAIRRAAIAQKGIVSYQDIATMYDCSLETARRWVRRLGVDTVDGPHGRRKYFDWTEIKDAATS